MTPSQQFEAAVNLLGFDYFTSCIKNGATPDQAKAEMLTEKAQREILKRVNELLA